MQLELAGSELLIYNSIAKLLHLLLLYCAVLFLRRPGSEIPLRYQAIPFLFCQAASTYACYQIYFSLMAGRNSIVETIGALCLLYVNVVICVSMEKLKEAYHLHAQAQVAEEKLLAQQLYYREMIGRQEETRSLWHDIKKYLLAMEDLAKSGEQSKIKGIYEEIQEKFAGLDSSVDVDNPEVSGILSYAGKKAQAAETELLLDVWVDRELDISPADLYVIIGNTADNAVEACQPLPKEERQIHLTLRQNNHILFYEISNPYAEREGEKPGQIHGYGLKNVEKCVRNHEGSMTIHREGMQFTVSIRLTV